MSLIATLEVLGDHGCDVANGSNGDKICADMVAVGRRVKQGLVSCVPRTLKSSFLCQPRPTYLCHYSSCQA